MAQGQAPHKPTKATRETVRLHGMVGTPQVQIAQVLGITDRTLRKYYKEELAHATASANAEIGGALYNKALKGDTAAMIFWLKTRAGFRETNNNEHTFPQGVPTMNTNVTPEQWEKIRQKMLDDSDC